MTDRNAEVRSEAGAQAQPSGHGSGSDAGADQNKRTSFKAMMSLRPPP